MTHDESTTSWNFHEVPDELKSQRRWVLWRAVLRDGKRTKVPVNDAGTPIDVTDSKNWRPFVDVITALERAQDSAADGLGVVLGDGLCGIDLDDVYDPQTGRLTPAAADIVATLASYTERSPSGTGVHVLAWGMLPDGCRHRAPLPGGGHIELYDRGRFFTVTGWRLPTAPAVTREATAAIVAVGTRYGLLPMPAPAPTTASVTAGDDDSDLDLLLVERACRSDRFFDALWSGNTDGYPSASEADLALCVRLLQLTGGDTTRADRLFRQSGLFRGKWTERRGVSTYGELTLQKALDRYRQHLHEPLLVASRNGGTPESPTAATGHDDTAPWRPRRLIDDDETAHAARGGWLDD
jgi:putative DNA primase/helicase